MKKIEPLQALLANLRKSERESGMIGFAGLSLDHDPIDWQLRKRQAYVDQLMGCLAKGPDLLARWKKEHREEGKQDW